MGRNKLSTDDRVNKIKEAEDLLRDFNENPKDTAMKLCKEINKIRSKTLRSLIKFKLNMVDDYTFMCNLSPKQISSQLNISERKVYDLIRTINLLDAISDISFNNVI